MKTATQVIREGPKCSFVSYQDRFIRYRTEAGFVFDVPVVELGSAKVSATERTATFLRWIRAACKVLENTNHTELESRARYEPESER